MGNVVSALTLTITLWWSEANCLPYSHLFYPFFMFQRATPLKTMSDVFINI